MLTSCSGDGPPKITAGRLIGQGAPVGSGVVVGEIVLVEDGISARDVPPKHRLITVLHQHDRGRCTTSAPRRRAFRFVRPTTRRSDAVGLAAAAMSGSPRLGRCRARPCPAWTTTRRPPWSPSGGAAGRVRRGSVGVRVERVVDHRDAPSRRRTEPVLRARRGDEVGHDPVDGDVELRDRRRTATFDGWSRRPPAPGARACDEKGGPTSTSDRDDATSAGRPPAARTTGSRGPRRLIGHAGESGSSTLTDRDPPLEDLGLGASMASIDPRRSRCTGPDGGEHRDVGRQPRAERMDLALGVHAHLGDEDLGAGWRAPG